jgi:hypothetical protein
MAYQIKSWELNIDSVKYMQLIQSAEDELSRDINRYIELMLKSNIKTQFMLFGFILDNMEFDNKADILYNFTREVFLDIKYANLLKDENDHDSIALKVIMDKYDIGEDEYSFNGILSLNFEGIAKWIIDNSISSIREEKLNKIGL